MFRRSVVRVLGAQRAYSTQPVYSKAHIEELLERVKNITAKAPVPAAKKFNKPQRQAQPQKSKSEQSEQQTPQMQRPKRPFQQRRNDGQQSESGTVSSSPVHKNGTPSVNTRPARNNNYRENNFSTRENNSNTRENNSTSNTTRDNNRQRRPMLTNRLRDVGAGGAQGSSSGGASRQRTQRRQRASQPRERKSSSGGVTQANPNIGMISTTYTPDVPTLESLLEESPLTSQTTESRILKAYRELKADGDANVSGVLTGQFAVASDAAFAGKLKTAALKHNAEVVVSCLNKNSSLDYETKMKLLQPLSGVAPVKQLTA